jgi:hypothetical protein
VSEESSTDEESVVVSHSFGPVFQGGMVKTKPSLASIGTFWLISFARGANLSRRIVSRFSVPSSPFIPWSDQGRISISADHPATHAHGTSKYY